MSKSILILLVLTLALSCTENQKAEKESVVLWEPYNDSAEVAANADHEKERMRYKHIQSKVLDKNEVFLPLNQEVSKFSEKKYEKMKPLVLEQNIPTIQNHISEGSFSYEDLVLFYLHRIYKYELPNETTLNTIIALNPSILEEVRKLRPNNEGQHPIYGMPILLKDNIGTQNMKTTAGAIALMDNEVDDAFIVKRLKAKGALILGKTNLSEWANFLCDCPNGQSAIGGQTLNPYGRRVFDTGGSSAGSGTSTAANYAVGAVGTETSGSILSPSSQNSVVGLKPTIGLLSRTGIVPISSTLDTPGPMTKNVIDNAILLDAMRGKDDLDSKSMATDIDYLKVIMDTTSLEGKRFGAMKNLMEQDPIYKTTIEKMQTLGAEIVEFTPPEISLDGFLSILNIDMLKDLPKYLDEHLSDSTSTQELEKIKSELEKKGRQFFDFAIDKHDLDAVLSINNYHAGFAAVAKYAALTIPMGYRGSGEPVNMTFIAKSFQEAELLQIGTAFEKRIHPRKIPKGYE